MADEYLTPEEAAALFPVSPITIRRKLRAGIIPARRVGRLRRIRRSDPEAAFAAAGNAAGPPPPRRRRRQRSQRFALAGLTALLMLSSKPRLFRRRLAVPAHHEARALSAHGPAHQAALRFPRPALLAAIAGRRGYPYAGALPAVIPGRPRAPRRRSTSRRLSGTPR